MSEPEYSVVLREFLDLYHHQSPRQAELVVPAWALERLNALPEEERRDLLGEIDQIAASHGLLTPTKIFVTAQRR